MKVFITGVTGKSGLSFFNECKEHKPQGYSFTFLVRDEGKAKELKSEWPEINYVIGSIENATLIHHEFQTGQYDIVLHIAGIHLSLSLIKEVVQFGSVKRLILVHTTGIYSKHKAASEGFKHIENSIDALIDGKDISLTVLRPTMIYGNLKDANVATFMKLVYKLRLFPVVNHAKCELQPVWYGDLGKAYYQVLMNPDTTKNKSYNLSGGRPISMIDMFKIMGAKLGVKNTFINVPMWLAYSGAWLVFCLSFGKLDYREFVLRLDESRTFSHADATADFGYTPVAFEEGINEEIQEFLEKYKK